LEKERVEGVNTSVKTVTPSTRLGIKYTKNKGEMEFMISD